MFCKATFKNAIAVLKKENKPGIKTEVVLQDVENFSEQTLEISSRKRIDIWRGAIAMIQDHPYFGVGYGLFSNIIPYYYPGGKIDAHNTYLIIAAEMGIPALIIFLWIVWIVFRNTLRLYKTTRDPFAKALALGFLGGIFGLLMSNMFGSRLDSQEVSGYFWILAALIVRLSILDGKHAEDERLIALERQTLDSLPSETQKLDADWSGVYSSWSK